MHCYTPAALKLIWIFAKNYIFYLFSGNFKSAAEIILNDLSASEQRQLAARLQGLLNNVLIEDVAVLAMFLTDNEHVRRQVIRVVTNFLTNDLQMILSQ